MKYAPIDALVVCTYFSSFNFSFLPLYGISPSLPPRIHPTSERSMNIHLYFGNSFHLKKWHAILEFFYFSSFRPNVEVTTNLRSTA